MKLLVPTSQGLQLLAFDWVGRSITGSIGDLRFIDHPPPGLEPKFTINLLC